MANELELLQAVKNALSLNPHIVLKPGVDEIKLTEKITQIYDFKDNRFFDKSSQQAADGNIDSIIFTTGKLNQMLEVINNKPFNKKLTHALTSPQMQRAKELTKTELENYIEKTGLVFKDQPYNSNEIKTHVISRILNSGFIIESDDNNGVALRQIKNDYISIKQFNIADIINEVSKGMVNVKLSELKSLEIDASLREKSIRLAGGDVDPKTKEYKPNVQKAERILEILKEEKNSSRIRKRLVPADKSSLTLEFQKEYMYKEGFVDEKELTLHQKTWLKNYVDSRIKDLETPTLSNNEELAVFEDRYRNYEKTIIDY